MSSEEDTLRLVKQLAEVVEKNQNKQRFLLYIQVCLFGFLLLVLILKIYV